MSEFETCFVMNLLAWGWRKLCTQNFGPIWVKRKSEKLKKEQRKLNVQFRRPKPLKIALSLETSRKQMRRFVRRWLGTARFMIFKEGGGEGGRIIDYFRNCKGISIIARIAIYLLQPSSNMNFILWY